MDEIRFVDTTLRDGQLSLWASNMTTGMMLPVAERFDQAGFEAVEVMSSAFYKKCVRDLKDDPWDRLRLLSRRIRKTPLRTIRSRSMLAFQISPPAVTDLWLERLFANGITEIRTSDPSNTPEYWTRAVNSAEAVRCLRPSSPTRQPTTATSSPAGTGAAMCTANSPSTATRPPSCR